MSGELSAVGWALNQVEAVRDEPARRLELLERTYHGPFGRAPHHLPFRRAAMAFMRWQLARGVLAPLDATPAGSPWWRAANERLLRDGCEAVARSGGRGGAPSSPAIQLWMSFIADPRGQTWSRAHNASIVSAYLGNRGLAGKENAPERFFLNVVLVRCAIDAIRTVTMVHELPLSRWISTISGKFSAAEVFSGQRPGWQCSWTNAVSGSPTAARLIRA